MLKEMTAQIVGPRDHVWRGTFPIVYISGNEFDVKDFDMWFALFKSNTNIIRNINDPDPTSGLCRDGLLARMARQLLAKRQFELALKCYDNDLIKIMEEALTFKDADLVEALKSHVYKHDGIGYSIWNNRVRLR
jgi:protein associated with RNAse G/E